MPFDHTVAPSVLERGDHCSLVASDPYGKGAELRNGACGCGLKPWFEHRTIAATDDREKGARQPVRCCNLRAGGEEVADIGLFGAARHAAD